MKKGLLIRLLAVAALLTLVIAMGCIRSSERERGGKGEIIHVGAYEPVKLDRVVYTLDGKNYVIAPQQEGNVIAAVRARVLNPESTQVTLSVDENAATLRDLNETQYKLIDPAPGREQWRPRKKRRRKTRTQPVCGASSRLSPALRFPDGSSSRRLKPWISPPWCGRTWSSSEYAIRRRLREAPDTFYKLSVSGKQEGSIRRRL